ncbi:MULTISPECIES: sensor histidine kinase [Methylobacterium]|uniref:histidine kinase n=1 Tax=Methylobacterium thuringiense TaxID=1003091 RepID=A0ABQ4TSI4_9HYPH|nr:MULTISPECIES: HAMP domain-containing sensor histidine kinase [Methylobacterium]TXN19337.1 HAMP domain-containing histidine kinase [Methylobacterium sp. WL9]GJE57849.1 Adaptive-response sensory-kinase SasA [Methylobacterium thuringiense]
MASLGKLLRSAGFRFALLYTAAFVLSVAALGFLVEIALTTTLREQAQHRIDAEVGALVDEFVHGGRVDLDVALAGRFARGGGRLSHAIVEVDGRVGVGNPDLAALAGSADTSARPVSAAGGRKLARPLIAATRRLGDGTKLVVADDLQGIKEVTAILNRAFAIALMASIVFGLGLGLVVSRRLLARVDAVTRTAEAIIAGDLGRRIALSGSGDDFDRLSRTLNRMLDRISGLMENLRQVTNDVAHDLRTPLTRLQHGLLTSGKQASTVGEYRASIDRAVLEIDEILTIFTALLRIAQIEAGARRAGFRSIDLSDVLRTVGEAYAPGIEDGGRRVRYAIEPDLRIDGDRELLVQLFANLIENALHYTPPGATISLELARSGAGVVAAVADDGPGIDVAERDKVLRRFYRVEKSRGTKGHGLGLPLVAAVAELHAAILTLSDNRPGLRAAVSFPAPA